MKKLLFITLFTITPILAQCDWNEDGVLNVIDVVETVDCILNDCWSIDIPGCTDPEAMNYNPDANVDDGSCEYSCTDIDGNSYQTITIGTQTWMAENLKVTHFNNGDEIPTNWPSYSGAYAVYNNDPSNAETYGNLYNWYAVDDSRNIAPEGWHVPTDEEWMELEMALGMSYSEAHDSGWRGTNEGSKLAGNSDLWYSGSLENNSEFGTSGFTALPGGYRDGYVGTYYDVGYYGYFWSSTENSSSYAWRRSLDYNNSSVYRSSSYKRDGFSVRCVRD